MLCIIVLEQSLFFNRSIENLFVEVHVQALNSIVRAVTARILQEGMPVAPCHLGKRRIKIILIICKS